MSDKKGLWPTPSTLKAEKYGYVSPKSVYVNKNYMIICNFF
jgi:hypothetical protein